MPTLAGHMIATLEKQRPDCVVSLDSSGAPCVSRKGTFIAISATEIAFAFFRVSHHR